MNKDLFKPLSNDASRAKTHTNHIINNTKTNNQRVVCERTPSSTRCKVTAFKINCKYFLSFFHNIFL